MRPEDKDLLATYAHGLLEGGDLEKAQRLAAEDPDAAAELRAIRQTLDEAAEWRPSIPYSRLENLPIPRLERGLGAARPWASHLLQAAALLAVGFGLGYAACATRHPAAGSLEGRQDQRLASAPAALTPNTDLLASGAIAHLAFTLGSNIRMADYVEEAPRWLSLLTEPEELSRQLKQEFGAAWEKIPAPPSAQAPPEAERGRPGGLNS